MVAGCVWRHADLDYIQVRFEKTLYYAHRIVWVIVYGDIQADCVIDHIDGDGTNNRIENLREVPIHVNARNARKLVTSECVHVGVYRTSGGRWTVRIHVMDRSLYLGTFETFDEAVQVRKKANREYGFTPRHGSDRTRLGAKKAKRLTGISWDRRYQKWKVLSTVSGETKYGGRFKCFGKGLKKRNEMMNGQ
jgi:hypothetical protein